MHFVHVAYCFSRRTAGLAVTGSNPGSPTWGVPGVWGGLGGVRRGSLGRKPAAERTKCSEVCPKCSNLVPFRNTSDPHLGRNSSEHFQRYPRKESLVRVVASAASFAFAHVHAVTFDRMQFGNQQNSRAHAYVAVACRVSVCASRTRSRPSDPQKSNSMILPAQTVSFVVRCVRPPPRPCDRYLTSLLQTFVDNERKRKVLIAVNIACVAWCV